MRAGYEELVPVASLTSYLDRKGIGEGPVEISMLGDGHSNLTFRLVRKGASVVLRRPPRPPFDPSAHMIAREGRLLRELAGTGLPVPRVLAICEDPEVLGAPFYLGELVVGRVLGEVLPEDLRSPRAERRIATELVAALARVHSVAWQRLPFASRTDPSGYLERQIRRFGKSMGRCSRQADSVRRLGRRLEATCPRSAATTLVHGDFRLGNVMYDAAGGLAAILDWEMATIGDPMADLGWLVGLWARPDDPVALRKISPLTSRSGFPTRLELAEAYAGEADCAHTELNWYVAFALWKFCVIMERNFRRALDGLSEDQFALDLGPDIPDLADFAARIADERW